MATAKEVARLAAGAKGGSAGLKEYDDAQAQVNSSRNEALRAVTHSAALMNAPDAFTNSLEARVAHPADTALGNLSGLGTADAGARSANTAGTSLYTQEANQAIPLITAEANRDLGQKIAMLNASTARSRAPKAVSNTALRTDLIGFALAQRAERAAQGQQNYRADLERLSALAKGGVTSPGALAPSEIVNTAQAIGPVGPQGMVGPGGPAPGPVTPRPMNIFNPPFVGPSGPQLVNSPATVRENFGDQLDQRAQARQAALDKLLNDLNGPGLTSEATQVGMQAGIDPATLYGLLTPQVDSAYVAANKRLGTYKDPRAAASVANQIIPATRAATELGLSPHEYRRAFSTNYFDWSGDPKLQATLQKWLATAQGAAFVGKPLADQQAAFEKAPDALHNQKNVVADVIADAHAAINRGYDYDTFQRGWLNEPVARSNTAAVALALKMVAPLFQYNAAQQRSYAPTG